MRATAWTRRTLAPAAALGLIGVGSGAPAARGAGRRIMLIHRVYVRDFWLYRHKATNREFAWFLDVRDLRSADGKDYFDVDSADARIHRSAGLSDGRRAGCFTVDRGSEDHPVGAASWSGARDHRLWRGRRRPTGVEWGKAASVDHQRRDPWATRRPTSTSRCTGGPANVTDPGDRRPAGVQEHSAAGGARTRARRAVRGAGHDDPVDALRVTIRRFCSYDGEHRGLARGHHHTGFRCATSEKLGGR